MNRIVQLNNIKYVYVYPNSVINVLYKNIGPWTGSTLNHLSGTKPPHISESMLTFVNWILKINFIPCDIYKIVNWTLQINFVVIQIKMRTYLFQIIHQQMSPAKYRPFCFRLSMFGNVLIKDLYILRRGQSHSSFHQVAVCVYHDNGHRYCEQLDEVLWFVHLLLLQSTIASKRSRVTGGASFVRLNLITIIRKKSHQCLLLQNLVSTSIIKIVVWLFISK